MDHDGARELWYGQEQLGAVQVWEVTGNNTFALVHTAGPPTSYSWFLGIGDTDGDGLEEIIWNTLNQGKVVPGYGHAVLRNTDPRFTAQYAFGKERFGGDELFKLAELVFKVAPKVLKEHGKAKSPWPNVDAISGTLQYHCGLKEYDFYTVLFGVSRIMGITANLVWARALSAPLERPQSITLDMLEQRIDTLSG